MLKILSIGSLFAAALLVSAGRTWADDAGGGAVREAVHERLADLNLSDEQEAKIHELRNEWHPKVAAAAQDLRGIVQEEMGKISDVLTPQQREKLRAMRDERKEFRSERMAERLANLESLDLTDAEFAKIAEIRNEYRPKIANALKDLHGVLNSDQMKAREQALAAGKKRSEVWQSLNLTDDQKQKFEAVGKEVRSLVHEQADQIRNVLSAEQQQKLAEMKDERKEHIRDRFASMVANAQDLNLTDDQKQKIAEIRKEYRPKVQEAGNKLRATVREELQQVIAVIKG